MYIIGREKKERQKQRMKTNIIYNSDCIQGMKEKVETNSVDLIITDPPFAIEFTPTKHNYNRDDSKVLKGYCEIKKEDYLKFTTDWLKEAYRTLKNDGSAYIFSGWNHLKDLLIALDNIGFKTINHIIWKYQFGVYTKNKYVTSHYHLLYVCKDKKLRKFYPYERYPKNEIIQGRKANYIDKQDVWEINREYWTGRIKTPNKLPEELIEKILSYSSLENDIILDPFSGSGQISYVCKKTGRQFIGFEICDEYYKFSKERIKKL